MDMNKELTLIISNYLPELMTALEREDKAWKKYSEVGIGNITDAMVKERNLATKEVDSLLKSLATDSYIRNNYYKDNEV